MTTSRKRASDTHPAGDTDADNEREDVTPPSDADPSPAVDDQHDAEAANRSDDSWVRRAWRFLVEEDL